jgi:hypothetical protein
MINQNDLSFTDRMVEGRDNAMRDRNRGLPVGKPAAGWSRKRTYHDVDATSWAWLCQETRRDWRQACRRAQNDFAAACLNGPGDDTDSLGF